MRRESSEDKNYFAQSLLLAGLAALLTFCLRWSDGAVPPFDDLYHLKRMTFTAQHFPAALEFDADRGEHGLFAPWPPLYDLLGAFVIRAGGDVRLLPPAAFALTAAITAFVIGRRSLAGGAAAGLGLAIAPYLIGISRSGAIDHHCVEPLLLLAIVASVARLSEDHGRRASISVAGLACAMSFALLVQPALLLACGLSFFVLLFKGNRIRSSVAFALAAIAIAAYRLTRPPGYPDSAWFLGWPHVAALVAASVALAAAWLLSREFRQSAIASTAIDGGRGRPPSAGYAIVASLVIGALVALASPATATAFASGTTFLGGDPWLRSIIEFQPMFRDASRIGTDLANLTFGVVAALLVAWRARRRIDTTTIFAIAYLFLAISSRRFLVHAIPLAVVAGAFAVARASTVKMNVIAALLTLLPPIAWQVATFDRRQPLDTQVPAVVAALKDLPRGRVLAPWSYGHAIDVLARQPVVLDNFGSMPDGMAFWRGSEALLQVRPDALRAYCRAHAIRYVVLTVPTSGLRATAASLGIDPARYTETPLARATVWFRLWRGERLPGLTPVRDGNAKVFEVH